MTVYLTNVGTGVLSGRMIDAAAQPEAKYVGWGTGAGAASVVSTDLSVETDVDLSGAGPARTAGALTRITSIQTNDTLQVQATRTATGAGTVKNLGLFDAVSGGTLVIVVDGQSILLAIGDSIQSTFKLRFS